MCEGKKGGEGIIAGKPEKKFLVPKLGEGGPRYEETRVKNWG